ncbi:MAG: aminotransferase class V-fold PLP-dependent enzyme [Oscillospiraceae bacterium]|nr:aminotransferase class V-fold PLP-dependent enzyme [Oscillospiraceae bacterium]
MIYLDNAATCREKPISVYRDMAFYTAFLSANAGRGGHYLSIKAAEKISDTAIELAELFNIPSPASIAFTQNATLALNMAILGCGRGKHIVTTSMEHNSVLRPVNSLGHYTVVKADREGFVNPLKIKSAIRHDTGLIVISHISNVCGSIQDIYAISAVAAEFGIPVLLDAAQSAGIADIDVEKMNISMLAFSGHKGLMGPLGTGGLYVRDEKMLEPVITGGTGSSSENLEQPLNMPDILHSGTMNTPAIAALGAGVRFIKKHTPAAILAHERELAGKFISELNNMDNVIVYGSNDISRRNGTVSFNIYNTDSNRVSDILNDKYRILVRSGWHCAYTAHRTIGSENGAVRASFGFFNTVRDVKRAVDAINDIRKR